MSKGGSKVQETSQQRALADYAKAQMTDYQARWLPVQRQLAAQIESLNSPGSTIRREAEGRSATDNAMQFAQAEGALQKQLSNTGVNVNSSRAKLATTGMSNDAATSRASGQVVTDQQIDNAYTQGLTALTSIGRGERSQVAGGLASQSADSARTAYNDAQISLAGRSQDAQMVGQIGGFGLQQAFKGSAPSNGPAVPNTAFTPNDGTGRTFNNPSAYVPQGYDAWGSPTGPR